MPGIWWSRVKNYLYDKELLRSYSSGSFVVSIGNLTWGGTGKTALTAQVAARLSEEKFRVAVVSRGYKRKSRGMVLVSDGKRLLTDWEQAGEEAYFLATRVPEAVVVVSKDRKAAFHFLEKYRPHIILLDDAFQHRRVFRDLDIVLIDASENLLKQKVIPFGKLREPLDALSRADVILLTHIQAAHASTVSWISRNIRVPVFHSDYQPLNPGDFRGKKVGMFCGIGAPRHFLAMLQQSGAMVFFKKRFPDHHMYTVEELKDLESDAMIAGAEILVTTEKDAVKVGNFPFRMPLVVIRAELKIAEERDFYGIIKSRLTLPKYA